MGAIFPKELPGQESKAEIILNAKPSCWVLSQRPLSRPNYQAAGLVKVPVASLDVAVTARPSVLLANLLDEVDMRQQGAAWMFLRIN
jgi:hypothetical protein